MITIIVTNTSDIYKMEKLEGKILSTSGRVNIEGINFPPYPKLLRLTGFQQKMIAQIKVDGYNVRLAFLPKRKNFIAILRGGYACAKTTTLLRKHFHGKFIHFFKDHPKKILCIEVVGRKSMANVHSDYFKNKYGFDEIGYFLFDVMDMEKPEDERFLSFEEVKTISEKYNLQLIPVLGIFDNIQDLVDQMQEIEPVFEGVVVKSLDGKEIWKYRFDSNKELFEDKIKQKPKQPTPSEVKIVSHFMQGYEEKELGLKSGITQTEMNHYQKMLDDMAEIITKDRSKLGNEVNKIVAYLLKTLQKHGSFDEETLKKAEKLFRRNIGSKVGKILSRMK